MNLFVECFVINRLSHALTQNELQTLDSNEGLKNVVDILKELGLGKYVFNVLNSQNANIAHVIANQVSTLATTMMQDFAQHYNRIVKVSSRNIELNKYQCQLWNTEHIIPFMFTFLDFKSLIQCSLVSSHWLYHAFNSNSIEYLDLTSNGFIKQLAKSSCYPQSSLNYAKQFRCWQRMIDIKYLIVDMRMYDDKSDYAYGYSCDDILIGLQHYCKNLKQLIILHPTRSALDIWKQLSPTMQKNNGNIQMEYFKRKKSPSIIDLIDESMSKNKLYLNRLKFHFIVKHIINK